MSPKHLFESMFRKKLLSELDIIFPMKLFCFSCRLFCSNYKVPDRLILSINNQQRYFLFRSVVEMRKGFDSLCGIVISALKMDPLSGDVFIFLSRTKTKIKLLQWQQDGFEDVLIKLPNTKITDLASLLPNAWKKSE